MRNLAYLVRAMLRTANAYGNLRDRKRRKAFGLSFSLPPILAKFGRILLSLIAAGMITFIFGITMGIAASEMVLAGLPVGRALQPAVGLTVVFVLFTAFLTALPVLVYGDDMEPYMLLPVSYRQLLAARLLTLFAGGPAYIPLGVFLPAALIVGIRTGQPAAFYVFCAVYTPVLALLPTALLCALLLPLARICAFMRDKDRMMHVSNAIVLLMSMAFGFGGQLFSQRKGNAAAGALAGETRIPLLRQVSDSLTAPVTRAGFGSFLLVLLVSVLALLLLLLLSNRLYFRLLTMGKGRSHRTLRSRDWSAADRSVSPLKTLLIREHRLVFRSPSFFMNAIVASLVYPIMLVGLGIFGYIQMRAHGGSLALLQEKIAQLLAAADNATYGWILFGTAVGLELMAAQGGAGCGQSLSREGETGVQLLRSLPIRPMQVFSVKLLYGWLFCCLPELIVVVALVLLLGLPFLLAGSLVLLWFLYGLTSLLAAMFIDWMRPKLIWSNEVQAVKNNLNGFLPFLVGLAQGALIGGLLYLGIRADVSWHLLLAAVVSIRLLFLFLLCLVIPGSIRRKWQTLAV